MISFFTKNRRGILILCSTLLLSAFYTYYVNATYKGEINLNEGVLNIKDYPFIAMNDKINIEIMSSTAIKVAWKNQSEDEKLYIQMFDGPFNSPPSEKFIEKSLLPNTNKIQLDFIAYTLHDEVKLAVFFMQYDDNKQTSSEMKEIYVNENSRMYTFNFPIEKESKYYKLAFRIMPVDNISSEIVFSNFEFIY